MGLAPRPGGWLRRVRYGMRGVKLDRGGSTSRPRHGHLGRRAHGKKVRTTTNPASEATQRGAAGRVSDGDFVLITRSGYTGTQRYAIVWVVTRRAARASVARRHRPRLRSAIIASSARRSWAIRSGVRTRRYYEFKDREVFGAGSSSHLLRHHGDRRKGTHAPLTCPPNRTTMTR